LIAPKRLREVLIDASGGGAASGTGAASGAASGRSMLGGLGASGGPLSAVIGGASAGDDDEPQ
jgi:hypothetical protein